MKRSFLLLLFIPFLFACGGQENTSFDEKYQITSRIEYDAPIKAPMEDLNWWVQNIEGSKREAFVNQVLDLAYSGKVKAYDYELNPLSVEEVKAIENYTDTLLVPSMVSMDVDSMVVIKHELEKKNITKMIFLEEWYFNPDKPAFSKKVLGLGPVLSVYYVDELSGESTLKGYKPLFWIFFEKGYPEKLK